MSTGDITGPWQRGKATGISFVTDIDNHEANFIKECITGAFETKGLMSKLVALEPHNFRVSIHDIGDAATEFKYMSPKRLFLGQTRHAQAWALVRIFPHRPSEVLFLRQVHGKDSAMVITCIDGMPLCTPFDAIGTRSYNSSLQQLKDFVRYMFLVNLPDCVTFQRGGSWGALEAAVNRVTQGKEDVNPDGNTRGTYTLNATMVPRVITPIRTIDEKHLLGDNEGASSISGDSTHGKLEPGPYDVVRKQSVQQSPHHAMNLILNGSDGDPGRKRPHTDASRATGGLDDMHTTASASNHTVQQSSHHPISRSPRAADKNTGFPKRPTVADRAISLDGLHITGPGVQDVPCHRSTHPDGVDPSCSGPQLSNGRNPPVLSNSSPLPNVDSHEERNHQVTIANWLRQLQTPGSQQRLNRPTPEDEKEKKTALKTIIQDCGQYEQKHLVAAKSWEKLKQEAKDELLDLLLEQDEKRETRD